MVLSKKSNMNVLLNMPNFVRNEEVQAIYYTILDGWQLTKEVILQQLLKVMTNSWQKTLI